MNGTVEGEVARYAEAVRAALADLPGPDRALLLEDLEDHLEEVAAEAGGPLAERLGAPGAYAAELRASAGLAAPGDAGRRGARRPLREWRVARRVTGIWTAALAHPAGRAVAEFLPELRPAWWVLRGYLAVQLLGVALDFLYADGGLRFPVPDLFGSQLLGLLASGAAVVGSVALGRRGPVHRRGHALTVLANAALGLFAVVLVTDLGATHYSADAYWDQSRYDASLTRTDTGLRSDGREITNIFAFDAAGRPLREVYLVDQEGLPLVATREDTPELEARLPLDRDGNEVQHLYPQRQEWVDPGGSGQRVPQGTPGFQLPPGPLRPPPDPPEEPGGP